MSSFLRPWSPLVLCALGACSGGSTPITTTDVPASVDTPASVDAGAARDVPPATVDAPAAADTPAAVDRPAASDAPPASDAGDAPPVCVQALITTMTSQPVGNPPGSIYRCTYQNATVYYLPPQCCDQFSALISSDCTPICAPDGGFTGRGDGRCTDFTRASCTLVWQDPRMR